MTEGTDTDPPTRYQTLRDGREFFVLFEHEDRKRAAEARRSETLSARIARNRGWLPIAPTPSERRYVSGLAALNLECPWNRVGDWHRSMWMAPAAEINEKLLWVEAREWATNTVLGREGVYDARGALRRCESRWTIAGFGIGGHPQVSAPLRKCSKSAGLKVQVTSGHLLRYLFDSLSSSSCDGPVQGRKHPAGRHFQTDRIPTISRRR